MNTDDISTIYEKDILLKSKKILFKLIKQYSYEAVIEYLFNPGECQNKKIEKYINYILNKIGVDTFANLLSNEELKSYYNVFNEELESNNIISNLCIKKEKEEIQITLKDITANENESKMLIEDKTSNNMSFIDVSKNKVKKSIVKDIESFIEEYTDEKIEINSFNEYNSKSIKSNISYINSESSPISEFNDSSINKADIISISEEDNETNNEKEKEEKLFTEIDSIIYSIIYKEPLNDNINYYHYENIIEENKINMKCADELCKSKGIYNISNKEITILVNHSISYEEHCYNEIYFEGAVSNLNLIDFIKDSPNYKGMEIKKIKKIKKGKEGGKISEKNKEIENKDESEKKEDIDKNEEVDKNKSEERKEDIIKEVFQYKTENNIRQIIDVENYIKSKELNNQDILISFDFNKINQNNINKLKAKTQNDGINKKSENKKGNKSINFEEKKKVEIKENNFNYIEFKIEDIKFNNITENNFTKNIEQKKQREYKNKNIYKYNYDRNYNNSNSISNSYIVIDNEKNDDGNSILSVFSNFENNNEIKEKIIEDNIDEKDYEFFYNLYGKMQMKKVENLVLFTDDFEKKKNLSKVKKKYQEKAMKQLLKRKKEQREPNINNKKDEKEVNEKKEEKDKKDISIITKYENKRKIFEVFYNKPSSMINLIEEEGNTKNINIIQGDKIKKRKPIFSVYNPNRNTPKFIVNNYVKINNINDIEKNINTKDDNYIFNNDINKRNINKTNKSNNAINNNKSKQNNQIHINKKNNKIKNKLKSIYNEDKKCNIKNNNAYSPNEVNNNENKDNNNINIDDEKDDTDDNKKYKILIKKTISNKKEDYLIGYDSTQNKNEIIFEINNKILYLNEYIIVRNKKIGFHFHKNEFGNVFNYFPTPFQTLQDIIQYKCCLRDCESRAEYYLKTKKFEIIKEHTKSNESHYFSNYNNYIFKKITEFMKTNSDIKDLQFILN